MSELIYKGYDLTVNTNVRKGLVGRVLWSHPDFDGAIDSNDIRCGGSSSVEDAIEDIDEVIRELDARKSQPMKSLGQIYFEAVNPNELFENASTFIRDKCEEGATAVCDEVLRRESAIAADCAQAEDDTVFVDREWLNSLGFDRSIFDLTDGFFLYYSNKGGEYHVSLCVGGETYGHEIGYMKTRGDVRRLVSALGIEVR